MTKGVQRNGDLDCSCLALKVGGVIIATALTLSIISIAAGVIGLDNLPTDPKLLETLSCVYFSAIGGGVLGIISIIFFLFIFGLANNPEAFGNRRQPNKCDVYLGDYMDNRKPGKQKAD